MISSGKKILLILLSLVAFAELYGMEFLKTEIQRHMTKVTCHQEKYTITNS